VFILWNKSLPPELEVVGICLPGRGRRISDQKYYSMKRLIPDLANALLPLLDKPYVLYGHSLGGLVAYEVVQELLSMGVQLPRHLFVGACSAALFKSGPKPDTHLHRNKTQEEMKQVLRNHGGTSEEVLNNKELMDLLLPMIQADFVLAQEYVHERSQLEVPVPITYFRAKSDSVVPEEMQTWNKHTSTRYNQQDLDAGHFFLQTHTALFLELFGKELKEYF